MIYTNSGAFNMSLTIDLQIEELVNQNYNVFD